MSNHAVIGHTTTWIGGQSYHTPAGLSRDRRAIASLLADRTPATVVLEIPADDAELVVELGKHNWQHQPYVGTGETPVWHGYRHPEIQRWIHIGQRDTDPVITGPADIVADRMGWWSANVRTPYRVSPAVTAIASIRGAGRRLKTRPRWKLQHPYTGEWWTPPADIHDLAYGVGCAVGLHQYDMRAAYLAAAAAVDLPFGQLRPTGTDASPWDSVGYYRLRFIGASYFTALLQPDTDGTAWVCHPVARWLNRAGIRAELIESHTLPHSGRILRPWAEMWRDAMINSDLLRPHLKAGYAQALGGLLAVRSGSIYRPDWRHMIMDEVRASILRRVMTVAQAYDLLPARVSTDALYYDRPLPAVENFIGIGERIGNMRYQGTVTEHQCRWCPRDGDGFRVHNGGQL